MNQRRSAFRRFRDRIASREVVIRFLKRIGKIVGVTYLVICTLLWGIQGHFIFHPVTVDWEPHHTTEEYEIVVDESAGIKSRGYILNSKFPGPVILFFTGNAGDALSYAHLFSELEVPSVLSNYRGYGKSDGKPSEKTLLADAKITLQMVRERFPDRSIILMGHSLGSAVAIRTSDSNIAGLILISPFRSLAHVANRSLLRLVPVHLLMRHKFDTRASLDSVPKKVLVLYSKKDWAIPAKETKQVLKRIAHADIIVDQVGHNTIFWNNLLSIRQWLEQNFEYSINHLFQIDED